jgi:hypothetical protein
MRPTTEPKSESVLRKLVYAFARPVRSALVRRLLSVAGDGRGINASTSGVAPPSATASARCSFRPFGGVNNCEAAAAQRRALVAALVSIIVEVASGL